VWLIHALSTTTTWATADWWPEVLLSDIINHFKAAMAACAGLQNPLSRRGEALPALWTTMLKSSFFDPT